MAFEADRKEDPKTVIENNRAGIANYIVTAARGNQRSSIDHRPARVTAVIKKSFRYLCRPS